MHSRRLPLFLYGMVWYTTGVPTNITKQPRARCHIGSLVQARSLLLATYRATQAAPWGKA